MSLNILHLKYERNSVVYKPELTCGVFVNSCICIPPVGKTYNELPIKLVYLSSLAIFEVGLVVCAWATTSSMFIGGRVINGIGSAGLISGAMLIIGSACEPNIRPLVTAAAMSMISIGSLTGPIIAGVLTSHLNWRWCRFHLKTRFLVLSFNKSK